jgi:predicted nucleotidyltransferase
MSTSIDFHKVIQSPEYDFLRNDPRLGDNIILLGLGGSHAYGTFTPTSDTDIRGIALNPAQDLLLGRDFEQVENRATDTVVYSFNKMVELLSECNPNTIEILGLNPEHYLIMSDVGREIVANSEMFLSKLAKQKFAGYASQQLRKLENHAINGVSQSRHEEHILDSIQMASETFREKYEFLPEDAVRLFIDKSLQEGYDNEIFMDLRLQHYPLRDWLKMWEEMQNILRSYNKLGMRNSKAIEHDKLGKHQMHLARLYMMGIELLRDVKIRTYRGDDIPFLMDIRAGKYLDENNLPTKEFRDMMEEWKFQLEDAAAHSPLPDKPDYERINRFKAEVNYSVITDAQFPLMEETR